MVKKILLLVAFVWALGLASQAEKVDGAKAKLVARNFYKEICLTILKQDVKEINISNDHVLKEKGEPILYVFNIGKNKGFVIVSADNTTTPILGFATEGYIDNANYSTSFLKWLEIYKAQILKNAENKIEASSEIKSEWERLASIKFQTEMPDVYTAGPLLTTSWGEKRYYNDKCPTDKKASDNCNGHTPAGSVAVSMAQVMKFYNYPNKDFGSFSLISNYGQLKSEPAIYNWDQMPNSLKTSNKDVSDLIYHCGLSTKIVYGPAKSGIFFEDAKLISRAFTTNFGYKSADCVEKSDYDDNSWDFLLRYELNHNRPTLYTVKKLNGNVFVCDGYYKAIYPNYTTASFYHINWGFDGIGNGFFVFSKLNPDGYDNTKEQAAIISVQPPATNNLPEKPQDLVRPTKHFVGEYAAYSINTCKNAVYYEWSCSDPEMVISGNGTKVALSVNKPGVYKISVLACNENGCSPEYSTTVSVAKNLNVAAADNTQIRLKHGFDLKPSFINNFFSTKQISEMFVENKDKTQLMEICKQMAKDYSEKKLGKVNY